MVIARGVGRKAIKRKSLSLIQRGRAKKKGLFGRRCRTALAADKKEMDREYRAGARAPGVGVGVGVGPAVDGQVQRPGTCTAVVNTSQLQGLVTGHTGSDIARSHWSIRSHDAKKNRGRTSRKRG